jgi:L-histidine N-alpha-methyltransferase
MPTATRDTLNEAVLQEALAGLTATPKTLTPWLFYDERGSQLFEQITQLPEYYLTRTERTILAEHADEILETASQGARLTLIELGAGTAAKTGLLLVASVARQGSVLYQPIDVSASALDEAAVSIATHIPGVMVESQVANYTSEPFTLSRLPGERALALYIGSSIGNFSTSEAKSILRNLREHLAAGDSLLLGTDLAPGAHKSVETLEAAYDDAEGVTAAFNLNVLARLNRDLGVDFRLDRFAHRALWNTAASRIEMHLESLAAQTVHIGDRRVSFKAGETIHTENSHKFTTESIAALLDASGFTSTHTWHDSEQRFAVTLAEAL